MFLTNCCKKSKDDKDTDDHSCHKPELVPVHYPRPVKVDPIMEVTFKVNGKSYTIKPSDNISTDTSLNTFLRTHANLRGTKFMCLEGGCGCCIVAIHGIHPVTKETTTWAVNSCMFPVFSCHTYEIITIEGIGDKKRGYHDLQTRLAKFNGTQCGYCSPGMVMNMYSLLEGGKGSITMEEVENSFGGNICRCTGYRPILDAFKSVAVDATEDLKRVCGDIEDLGKFCTKMNKVCSGNCSAAFAPVKNSVRLTDRDGKDWFKVASLQELLDTMKGNAGKKYMLVHGNTAHGVYRRDEDIQVFIDVNGVDELHTVNITDNGIIFGGNVSLTETMNTLLKAADSKKAFEYCRHVWKHIDLVANVPVRNAGTLAGNLSIKHQHNYFPSDIFLLLETTGSMLEITSTDGTKTSVKPSAYLTTDMTGKVITKITLPPLPGDKFLFRSFKIMPRAQNAHAYVNAGFLIEFNEAKMIKNATVVFGGIKPEFIHATQAEAVLKGKDLFTNDALSSVRDALYNELDPDWVLPDASPDYRKNLAVSLFYKFLLNTCPEGKVKPEFATGGKVLERPLSSGKQEFDSNQNNWPLNQDVQKLEGLIQCAGEAEYVNDLVPQPNELWAAFVHASDVGSKIIKIDATEALKLPGVAYFYSAKDIPGDNNFMTKKVFGVFEDEEIFCDEDVRFNGQPCGIILADTLERAHQGAKLVKVVYGTRSNKPILPMLKDVLRANAKERIHNSGMGITAADVGGLCATQKIKGHFEMGGQYHFTMEAQSCVVVPSDEGLDVYSSTQWMDLTQIAISDMLNIQANTINVYTKRLGGAYGCKISRATQIACACALAAYLSHRPVRFVLKIESNMEAVGKRPSVVSDYEADVDANGKIAKLTNNYSEDYGCSINEPVIFGTQGHFPNCYNKELFTYDGKAVITDSPANTWCRAPGTTEGIAMIENIMDHIARELKKDPVQVRLQNIPASSQMKTILPQFVKDIDYEARRQAINQFNSNNRWRKRGIAVVPMHYNMEYFGTLHALVSIYHADGSVNITHGGIEMGQGINTKAAQVAAHILGIPLDKVSVKKSNSLTAANDFVTGGSMGSEAIAYAVKQACETLNTRLAPVKEKNKTMPWADLVHTAYNESVDLTAYGFFKASDVKTYIIWGCAAAEVEIDFLTGNYLLNRVDILEDTGESLSPGVDVGQVEGAFIMGMGYWLQEELVYDNTNGQLKTNRTWNYKPPTAKDIPVDFRVKFLHNSSNPNGVLRSKATGEPATCMSIVVLFAVRDAVDAARRDAGLTDTYTLDAPATVEKIFLAGGGSMATSSFVLK